MTISDPVMSARPCGGSSQSSEHNTAWHALARAVVAAARKIDETRLVPVGVSRGSKALQPRALLAMLTFCYARQIYGSAEVANRLRQDEGLRRLCGDETPDAVALREFRNANRLALNFCLRGALRCMAEEKVAQGQLTHVSEQRVAEDADRRITMALFTDSTEMPDGQSPSAAADCWSCAC